MVKKLLVILGFAVVATSAQAITVTKTLNQATSTVAGATTVNFEDFVLGGPVVSQTRGVATYSGGGIFTGSHPLTSLQPYLSTGNYLSVGTNDKSFDGGGANSQQGPIDISFAQDAKYFGFLWGSVDGKYPNNKLEIYKDGSLLKTILGSDILATASGKNTFSYYVELTGGWFDELKFYSNGNAFETDNHAFSTVPVPAALPLMASALGLFGISRRKNKADLV